MNKFKKIQVDIEFIGKRLDLFLIAFEKELNRSQARKLIQAGQILVNGVQVKAGYILRKTDIIEFCNTVLDPAPFESKELPLDILYEDQELIVLNKAAGVVVHPGAGSHEKTLVHGLMHYLGKGFIEANPGFRPGIVHRLDKDTTGVMVCAKNPKAHERLAKQFADKTNDRVYLALLDGNMLEHKIYVENYLYRDPKHRLRYTWVSSQEYEANIELRNKKKYRQAITFFEKVHNFGHRFTLARVKLKTGRTHQIRVHAKSFLCLLLVISFIILANLFLLFLIKKCGLHMRN